MLKDSLKNISTKNKVIITVASVIVLLFIITLPFLFQNKKLESVNMSGSPTNNSPTPEDYLNKSKDTIWETIKTIDGTSRTDVDNAVVRANSFSESKKNNTTTTSFLVDLDSIHYSFKISFTWKTTPDKDFSNTTISLKCPDKSEIIYTDTACPASVSKNQVEDYLPHEEQLDSDTKVSLSAKRYDSYQKYPNERYILAQVNSCTSKDTISRALSKVNDWIKSLYINPDDLHIEVSCNYCALANDGNSGTSYCKTTNDQANSSYPLLNELPYADVNFKVEAVENANEKLNIIIFIQRYQLNHPEKAAELEKEYQNEAFNWIKSLGYNIEDYPYRITVEYY